MVLLDNHNERKNKDLSVLALSSRFDGQEFQSLKRSIEDDFQYSLCRVVLMVVRLPTYHPFRAALSVLALSSRFDGPTDDIEYMHANALSVLALSSRFDGPADDSEGIVHRSSFQYSLCRVVLMVSGNALTAAEETIAFQYSLCRVVLMVVCRMSLDDE